MLDQASTSYLAQIKAIADRQIKFLTDHPEVEKQHQDNWARFVRSRDATDHEHWLDGSGIPRRLRLQIVEQEAVLCATTTFRALYAEIVNRKTQTVIVRGGHGSGKGESLAYFIARHAWEIRKDRHRGASAYFLAAPNWPANFRETKGPEYDVAVLAIDDLGLEAQNRRQQLEHLFYLRTVENRQTVIATELSDAELHGRYDERILRRLFRESKTVEL